MRTCFIIENVDWIGDMGNVCAEVVDSETEEVKFTGLVEECEEWCRKNSYIVIDM